MITHHHDANIGKMGNAVRHDKRLKVAYRHGLMAKLPMPRADAHNSQPPYLDMLFILYLCNIHFTLPLGATVKSQAQSDYAGATPNVTVVIRVTDLYLIYFSLDKYKPTIQDVNHILSPLFKKTRE